MRAGSWAGVCLARMEQAAALQLLRALLTTLQSCLEAAGLQGMCPYACIPAAHRPITVRERPLTQQA